MGPVYEYLGAAPRGSFWRARQRLFSACPRERTGEETRRLQLRICAAKPLYAILAILWSQKGPF